MPSIKVLNISLVLLCILVTAFICTFLAISSGDTALDDTKLSRDTSVSSCFAVGEESVQNRTTEYLDLLMEGVTDYVYKFLEPKNQLIREWVNEIEANPWDSVKHWDWHNLARYYWAFRNQQASGVNAVGVTLRNQLQIGLMELGTSSRGPDEYHHRRGFFNYGTDHPLGGSWKGFTADVNQTTGQPLVNDALTDVNWDFKTCRESSMATNGSVLDEPCGSPWPPDDFSGEIHPPKGTASWSPPTPIMPGLLAIDLEGPVYHGIWSGRIFVGIDLQVVKTFLQQLKIGGPVEGHPSRSRVYITVRSNKQNPLAAGNLVGASHGSVTAVANVTTNDLAPMVPINSSDPIISGIATAVEENGIDLDEKAATGSTTNMNITTSYAPGGEVFYYKVGRVVDENGADWYVHVVMDRAYILGEIDRKTTETRDTISAAEKKVEDDLDKARTLLYVLVIVVAVVLIVVSVVFVLKIIEPLVVLEREMAMVAVMKLEGVDTGRPLSILQEVRLMQVSFLQMMKNLVEYRNYMPASVLQDESEEEEEEEEEKKVLGKSAAKSSRGSMAQTRSSVGTSVANRHTALGSMEAKQKRVTLMACNMLGFLDNTAKVLGSIADYLSAGLVLVKGTKGIPDGFSGDRLYVSWNGVRPCSSHKTAAYKCARGFTIEKSLGKKFSIGIVSGDVKCGNMGCDGMKKFSFVGSLASWVHIVERVGRVRGSNITIDSVVHEEVANAAFTRLLQHVVYAKHSPKVLLLHEAMQEKEVQEEEWMYQLEEGNKQDKNAPYNTSFRLFMKEDVEEAIKALEGYEDTGSEVVKLYKEKLNAALNSKALCKPYGELERVVG